MRPRHIKGLSYPLPPPQSVQLNLWLCVGLLLLLMINRGKTMTFTPIYYCGSFEL